MPVRLIIALVVAAAPCASVPEPGAFIRLVFRAASPGERISPDLAGKVAAVFALAARTGVGGEGARLLDQAVRVYARADRQPRELTTAYPSSFCPEQSYQDEMELAAVEPASAAKGLGDPRADEWAREADGWAAVYLGASTKGTLGIGDVSALAHADLVRLFDAGARAEKVMRADLVADLGLQLEEGRSRANEDLFHTVADHTGFGSVHRESTGADTYLGRRRGVATGHWGANAWGCRSSSVWERRFRGARSTRSRTSPA